MDMMGEGHGQLELASSGRLGALPRLPLSLMSVQEPEQGRDGMVLIWGSTSTVRVNS